MKGQSPHARPVAGQHPCNSRHRTGNEPAGISIEAQPSQYADHPQTSPRSWNSQSHPRHPSQPPPQTQPDVSPYSPQSTPNANTSSVNQQGSRQHHHRHSHQQQDDSRTVQPRLLYMDTMNFATEFIPTDDWSMRNALRRTQEFVDAARSIGLKVKCFIDDAAPSVEASEKWRTRREREIWEGRKNVPHGLASLLGDLFRECGVEVAYSDKDDNDDTLAWHAHADGANIFSNDKDMFRYTGAQYTVYGKYHITNGRLVLVPKPRPWKGNMPPPRDIGPPPAIRDHVSHASGGIFRRGVPTPLLKALNKSPHRIVAPLRAAAFHRCRILGPIVEEWPEWDDTNRRIHWHHQEVNPIADLALPEDPEGAVEHLFGDEASGRKPRGVDGVLWERHVKCMRSLVYEMCVQGSRGMLTLLQLWLRHEG